MSSAYPDLVIYLGIRAVLSLIGILVAVMSYWYAERKWDEQGSAAYATALENAPPENSEYQFVEEGSQNKKYVTNPDGSRDAISVCTEDFREEQRTNAVQVPREELEKALSIPYGILAGLALWTISFLFKTGHKVKPYFGWNISWLLFLPVIAVLIAFPIRNATIDRNLELKKKCVAAILVLSIWLIVSGIAEKETDAPWYFCVFGALFLFISYHATRRGRKMGITWEFEGQPAPDISSQSLGALFMILGFFLIWVGTNACVYDSYADLYIPIHLNYRGWFVFIATFFVIIPAIMALDFAFDQGSKPIGYDDYGILFELDGKTFEKMARSIPFPAAEHFAGFLETPWIVVSGWTFFGLCAFMPFGGGFTAQKFFACLLAILIGIVYGLCVLPSYWNGELKSYRGWSYVYFAFMMFLFTSIGVDGQYPLITSIMGVIMILLGQHVDMLEKKRGKYWLQGGESNPHEIAFGYGHPLYVLGWLLLSMAMSIPM